MAFSLNTARALVVDDKPEETVAVIRALGRMNIGVTYLDGDINLIPEEPLPGIHLAFVDMQLFTPAVGAADEEIVEPTARYMARVFGEQDVLLVLIAWTNKPRLADTFCEFFKQQCPNARIVHFIVKEKPPEGDQDAAESIVDEICDEVETVLQANPGLKILWSWEHAVHRAASGTTSRITQIVASGLARDNPAEFEQQLLRVLAAMALAGQEAPPEDAAGVGAALVSALLPVLSDKADMEGKNTLRPLAALEALREAVGAELDFKAAYENAKKLEIRKNTALELLAERDMESATFIRHPKTGDELTKGQRKKQAKKLFSGGVKIPPRSGISEEQSAGINRMLHLTDQILEEDPRLPGNLYFWGERIHSEVSTSDQSRDEQTASILAEIGIRSSGDADRCFPVLIEVSPICDIAQGKAGPPQLICAAFIPANLANKLPRNALHIRTYGPIQLDIELNNGESISGLYNLTCNAKQRRHAAEESLRLVQPIVRLRTAAVIDLQAWLSAYSSRPGMIQVDHR